MKNASNKNETAISFKPIGYIQTNYKTPENMPIQPKGAAGETSRIILENAFEEGLTSLNEFSHIYLIYYFHHSDGYSLKVQPFMDNKKHGVFATRAPRRPNPIGISIVKLLSIKNNEIHVEGADLLDGTPILDIKPYIEQFDGIETSKSGWVTATAAEIKNAKSDQRFQTK